MLVLRGEGIKRGLGKKRNLGLLLETEERWTLKGKECGERESDVRRLFKNCLFCIRHCYVSNAHSWFHSRALLIPVLAAAPLVSRICIPPTQTITWLHKATEAQG